MDPSVMESPIAGTATTSAAAKALAAARNSRRATSEPTDLSRATRLAVRPSSANEDTTALFLFRSRLFSVGQPRRVRATTSDGRYSGRRRRALDVAFARKNGDFRETKPRRPALASRCASENGEGDAPGGVARGEGGGRDVARADKGLRGGAVVGTRALA
jgi:hypothetical protein